MFLIPVKYLYRFFCNTLTRYDQRASRRIEVCVFHRNASDTVFKASFLYLIRAVHCLCDRPHFFKCRLSAGKWEVGFNSSRPALLGIYLFINL